MNILEVFSPASLRVNRRQSILFSIRILTIIGFKPPNVPIEIFGEGDFDLKYILINQVRDSVYSQEGRSIDCRMEEIWVDDFLGNVNCRFIWMDYR